MVQVERRGYNNCEPLAGSKEFYDTAVFAHIFLLLFLTRNGLGANYTDIPHLLN